MVLVAVKRKDGLRYSILDKKITSDIWECSITWHLEEVGNGFRVFYYFYGIGIPCTGIILIGCFRVPLIGMAEDAHLSRIMQNSGRF